MPDIDHPRHTLLALGTISRTRTPDPKYPNPILKYQNPKCPISISGMTLRNPNLIREIQVYGPGT
jgi:hypothetical protein